MYMHLILLLTDIDDCHEGVCFNDGSCVDGINSFSCDCVDGFEGDLCETSKSPYPLEIQNLKFENSRLALIEFVHKR